MQSNFKSKWARCMKNIRVEPWDGGIMGNVVSVQHTLLLVSTVFTAVEKLEFRKFTHV